MKNQMKLKENKFRKNNRNNKKNRFNRKKKKLKLMMIKNPWIEKTQYSK